MDDAIMSALARVDSRGSWCAVGREGPAVVPNFVGFGQLPLPVHPAHARALAETGEPAPYGRGPHTLVDPDVRRCAQIAADRVAMPRTWPAVLDRIVAAAADGLGVTGTVRATLYKALVYQPGDFFVAHRDSEKEPGMFATLVVTLPGAYTGGALIVRHGGQSRALDLRAAPGEVSWAAFYADCEHELHPLVEGARVALIYNLVRPGGAPTAPRTPGVAALVAALRGWPPDALLRAIVLEHRYTEAELGWGALKGHDRAVAVALREAGARTGCVVRLALLSIRILWAAEELQWRGRRTGRGRGRWVSAEFDDDDVPDDLELIEEIERQAELRAWIDADGQPVVAPDLPVVEDDLLPERAIDESEPDEQSYHEATGNEGAELTRTYRRAVVTIWPRDRADLLVVRSGPEAVARALDQADRGRAQALLALAAGGLDRLDATWHLRVVRRLTALDLPDEAARLLLASHHGSTACNEAAEALFTRVEPRLAAAIVERGVERGYRDLGAAVDLLERATRSPLPPGTWSVALNKALALIGRLDAWGAPLPALVRLAGRLDHRVMRDALIAGVVDEQRFDQAAIAAEALGADCPAWWRYLVLTGLDSRLRVVPVAPTDLAREPVRACSCRDCQAFSTFLCDPAASTVTYAMSASRRDHLAGVARSDRLDVEHREVRTGNPHKIVFTKNDAGFRRAVARRELHLRVRAAFKD